MESRHTNATALSEMNLAVRLLWRHGYSLRDHGTSVTVDDPVCQAVGGKLVVCEHKAVVIRSSADARRFIEARK